MQIWTTLEKIRLALNVNHIQFAEMLSLTQIEYWALIEKKKAPSLTQIFSLIEKIDVSFENILTDQIDYKSLSDSFSKNKQGILPEKYQIAAHSRVRTIQVILKYLENFHSARAAENVIRHFQLPRTILNDPNAKINIKLIAEIYEYVSKHYIHQSLLVKVGEFSRIVNSGGPLDKILSKHRNVKMLYSHVVEELIATFDENFDYSIQSIKGNILKVGVIQRKDIAEALKQKHISNVEGCTIRGGIGSSFTGYMGLSHAHVNETKCVLRGDPICLYEYNLEKPIFENKNKSKRPALDHLLYQ